MAGYFKLMKFPAYFFLPLFININTAVTRPTQTAPKTEIIIIPLLQFTNGKYCKIIGIYFRFSRLKYIQTEL
ncbi:hypothetical protein SAMN03080594_106166 [Arenibacter palladensis]|uniref:Uncharacterized protein n=1 Tax=Arenibacter palladensis TaxID=237373 RepID=A0A1M5DN75_9FLAO|nr:hypothetical protein SAMN03080594_106166 [Arenibacter palladensis]